MTDSRRPPLDARPRPCGEGGSMVLAVLVSMLTLTIGGMLFGSIVLSERNARQGRDFTTSLETADAGIQHALAQLNGGAATPTPPASPMEVGDATVTYTATPAVSSTGGAAWEITSTATSLLSGEQRRVVARVEEEPRFPFAMFTDDGIDFPGSNLLDSYSSGVLCTPLPGCAWDEPYTGAGIAATNGDLEFNGNASADGATLYNWAADPDTGRCQQTGGGNMPNPCDNLGTKNERLDLATPSEIEFIELMEDVCDDQNRWIDWRASEDASVPRVLQPHPQLHCFEDLLFDVDTILAPLTNSLAIQPVIIVVKQGGTVQIEQSVDVNCPAPCLASVSVPAAPHLQIYTLSTNNVFSMKPQSNFAGAVYAPLAGCGGNPANAQAEIYGSIICDNAYQVGGWNLHYDQALSGIGNGRYLVREWREEPV